MEATERGKSPVLVLTAVSKSFRSRGQKLGSQVLENINIELELGQTLAVLGDNGSGKTTLLKIMAGLVIADQGEVRLCGESLGPQARAQLGFAGGGQLPWPRLSVRQNLSLLAGVHRLDAKQGKLRLEELSHEFELDALFCRRVTTLSSGQRARVELACAVLHRPRLLVLDEITRSLDADGTQLVWRFLQSYTSTGGTVVLATHSSAEAEALALRRLHLKDGKLSDRGELV